MTIKIQLGQFLLDIIVGSDALLRIGSRELYWSRDTGLVLERVER